VFRWPPPDAAHLLVRSEQMAALEAELFASGLPVAALMEKAALQISRRLLAQPERLAAGVLVLVGPGHNGADGLVVARELHLAGVAVRIWCPFERQKPLAAEHRRHACWLGIPALTAAPDPGDSALWIDALFGIGQHRAPAEDLQTLLAERQAARAGQLVAIDVPTGLCADEGRVLGRVAACASQTFCLGLLKQGLVQDSALAWVGQLERFDLALPAALLAALPVNQPLGLSAADLDTAPRSAPPPEAAKYGRGRLLVVAGSDRYRGAALLSLLGASASGCGSLRAAVPAAVAAGLWAVQPQVVIEAALAERPAGGLALAPLAGPGVLDRLDAVLLGPGIGHGPACVDDTDEPAWRALQDFPGLLVLDADGLNRLAGGAAGSAATTWLQQRRGSTWLTPHAGEFSRLFPDLAGRPPLEAAAAAAGRCQVSVLLKGARTVVAAADGRRWQLLEAAAAAARAGLGDVLAGYAAGRGAAAGWGDLFKHDRSDGGGGLLAAVALEHAQAGLASCREQGQGAATPQAIAQQLSGRAGRVA